MLSKVFKHSYTFFTFLINKLLYSIRITNNRKINQNEQLIRIKNHRRVFLFSFLLIQLFQIITMKKNTLIAVCLFLSFVSFAQENNRDYDLYPTNWFLRLSPGILATKAIPATIDLSFKDDDLSLPDTASTSIETDNLWSYGINAEISYLMKHDLTLTHNAFFGVGDRGMFTYSSTLEFGKEMPFGKFFVQPRFGISYIFSNLRIGSFYSNRKAYFDINNRRIYDEMRVLLRSRTFALTPSVSIDYPINDYISIFTKFGGNYTFGRRSYLTFTGETDEVDQEGDYIVAYERRNFDNANVDIRINEQQLFSTQSPYLHYNFNTFFIQLGATVQIVEFY